MTTSKIPADELIPERVDRLLRQAQDNGNASLVSRYQNVKRLISTSEGVLDIGKFGFTAETFAAYFQSEFSKTQDDSTYRIIRVHVHKGGQKIVTKLRYFCPGSFRGELDLIGTVKRSFEWNQLHDFHNYILSVLDITAHEHAEVIAGANAR